MTIETTTTKAHFKGNGSGSVFPLPFPALRPEHVRLVLTDAANGLETTLTDNYTVTGCGAGNVSVAYPLRGDPLPPGSRLTIFRQVPLVQQLDLQNASMFDAEVIEGAFDSVTMQVQQLSEKLDRAVTVSISDTRSPEHLRDDLFAAADLAAQSAAAAAADRSATENSAASAARLAAAAAQSAEDAMHHQPDATEGNKGITRLATVEEHQAGAAGVAAQPVHVKAELATLEEVLARLADSLGVLRQDLTSIAPRLTFIGKVDLLPIRPEDLSAHAPGWYFCNGDRYTLDSPIGTALNGLSANYKADWAITISGNTIALPNLLHSDGRGMFIRAANGTSRRIGTIEIDALQNITGHFNARSDSGIIQSGFANGCFYPSGSYSYQTQGQAATAYGVGFDASRSARTSTETRPLNIGMTPAIYLGV